MLWSCVAARGIGNIALVEGKIDSSKYQHILEANITTSTKIKVKRGWLVLQ